MFVRIKATPNSPRKSIQIVESIRKGDRVTQKIVHYVGISMDDDSEAKLKLLGEEQILKIERQRLEQQQELSLFPMNKDELDTKSSQKYAGRRTRKLLCDIIPVDQVSLSDIIEEKRIIDGVDDIGRVVYDDLNFTELLAGTKYNRILMDVVLARLIYPYSKLKLCRFMLNDFDKQYHEDQIYRLMDKLYPKIDEIKIKVFNKTQALMPSVKVLLFDVTTLYCESIVQDELREFGFSKDGKFNNTQVVLALATNELGLPIGYELFQGNCAEVKTLIASIHNWQKLFDIQDVCFIADRAMFSDDNLQLMEDHNYQYIVAAKLRVLSESLQQDILNEDNYTIQKFSNGIGWVGKFAYPNNPTYVCELLNNINQITTTNYNSYVAIGDKGNINNICYVDSNGVINPTKNLNSEITQLLNGLSILPGHCYCEVMSEDVFNATNQSEHKENIAIIVMSAVSEQVDINNTPKLINQNNGIEVTNVAADGSEGKFKIFKVFYNKETVEVNNIILAEKLLKYAIKCKIPNGFMNGLFNNYAPIKRVGVLHKIMQRLFPNYQSSTRQLCVSYKTSRARNDAYKREKILKKLEAKQGKADKVIKTIAKKYMTTTDGTVALDSSKISIDEDWDGMHGIVTNITGQSPVELLSQYSNLWRIEEAFRINKHNLGMRPIYHYKPERIKTHIAICYMAFSMLKLIQYQTQLTQPRFTIDNILETMLQSQSSIYVHKRTKDRYRVPGAVSHEVAALYRAFGLTRSRDASVYLGK